MVNILISGYYGFDNIGDESILRTLVSSLLEHIPDCSLTVLSHNPTSTREKYGVEAVDRMSPMAILRAVKKCDMLISGGGSLLQDVTSSKSLHYYLSIIRCAEFFHKKVFIYSQGIGPIDRPGNRRAAAAALKRAVGIAFGGNRHRARQGRHHGGPRHPHEKARWRCRRGDSAKGRCLAGWPSNCRLGHP